MQRANMSHLLLPFIQLLFRILNDFFEQYTMKMLMTEYHSMCDDIFFPRSFGANNARKRCRMLNAIKLGANCQ